MSHRADDVKAGSNLNIGIKATRPPGGAAMVASLRERVIRICRGGGCRHDRKDRTVRMYLDSQP